MVVGRSIADHADFLEYYNLEGYLFGTVTPRFRREGTLSAFDFFCIVAWKSNRSKSKIARRLLAHGHSDLDAAVAALMESLREADSPEARFMVLCRDHGFRLPMASAVLTVLYPEQFTVYDYRVCDVLGRFHKLANRTNCNRLWKDYSAYIEAVREAVREPMSLRDKDRSLWGRSFAEQLQRDIDGKFGIE